MLSGDEDATSPPVSGHRAKSRRREQVRRAQRTHRERRAKYLKGLEADVDILRAKDASNVAELARIIVVNDGLRTLLMANHIPIPSELQYRGNNPASYSHEAANTRVTPARSDITTSHTTSSSASPGLETSAASFYDLNDPQTAVDFILALEAICLEQHHHHRGEDGEMGHFLQLQHIILETPQSSRIEEPFYYYPPVPPRNTSPTHLQDTLNRLLAASRLLNITGELTPVQCWDMLRAWPPASNLSKHKFDELKRALVAEIVCYGFGATMSEPIFLGLVSRLLSHSEMNLEYSHPNTALA